MHDTNLRRDPGAVDRRRGATRAGIVLGAWTVALLSGGASAQNALGDGRALDNSLGQGGRSNYERPSFAQELQFRNAVVTGNAPGGLSFRGDLGYRAAGEFSEELGSDSLFAFRRDSLYSGLAGMGIRGTDALQYQFSLTTGAQPPKNLVGDLTYTRIGEYQNAGALGFGATQPGTIGYDPRSNDTRGLSLYRPSAQEPELNDALTGTLRSSSSYTSTTNLTPVMISVFEQGIERREFGLTASPLTGVSASPMVNERDEAERGPRDPFAENGRTAFDEVADRIRARAALQERLNRAEPASSDATRPPADPQNGPNTNQNTGPNTDPTTDPDAGTGVDAGAASADPTGTGVGTTLDSVPGAMSLETARSVVDRLNAVRRELREGAPEGTGAAGERERFQLDKGTLELIRASDAPITALIDPNAESRNLYTEHMKTGERLIRVERYFDAEERFARALAIKPGDQSAQIGRIHAQIGAGLVLSASVNLRSLYTAQPELMGVRYDASLLPAPERVDAVIEVLRERTGLVVVPGAAREDLGVRRGAALLLAYLGAQTGRPDTIREGLGIYRTIGAADDLRLINILRQVWLPDDPAIETGPDSSGGRAEPETGGEEPG